MRGEAFFAESQQLSLRIGGEPRGVLHGEVANGAMNDRAAVACAWRRIDGVERIEPQNILGIDGVGVAQPVLDRRNGKPRRTRVDGRRWPRPLRRLDNARLIECARQFDDAMAPRQHMAPALGAGNRGHALDEARGHRWRAGELGGAGQNDFGRAERLREVMRGEADAALGRVKAKVAAHWPRQPRIAARLRRPGGFV